MRRTLSAFISNIQGLAFIPTPLRVLFLRKYGVVCGHGARVYEHVHFSSNRVEIGRESFVNVGCYFDASEKIIIGNKVSLAPLVRIITTNHEIGPPENRAGISLAQTVHIGDGCWIGAGASVLPGVTVGAGCVIAAGAVITRDCQPNGLYAGVPGRRLRDL